MKDKIVALNQSEIASVAGGIGPGAKLLLFLTDCAIARLHENSCDADKREGVPYCYLPNLLPIAFTAAGIYIMFA